METPSPIPTLRPGRLPDPRRRSRSPRVLSRTLTVALIVATLFVIFTPGALSGGLSDQLNLLLTPQPEQDLLPGGTPRPRVKIGIVAGHWGNDSGAVCENGTTEVDVNLRIATLVQQKLTALGFETDLLEEFDPRLKNYQAAALISIHNDSCVYINDQATGFKVARAMSARDQNLAGRLEACLRDRYQRRTGLPLHNSVTNDMTFYHAFEEVSADTTAAIIETGFLNLDYRILTENTDQVATGVVDGILCFINNENIAPTAAP